MNKRLAASDGKRCSGRSTFLKVQAVLDILSGDYVTIMDHQDILDAHVMMKEEVVALLEHLTNKEFVSKRISVKRGRSGLYSIKLMSE